MRARYDTVIFDLDGTLLNTLGDLTAAANHALRESGYPERTAEEVRRFVGNGVGMLIRRALPVSADSDEEAFEETLQAFKSYYARHNNDTTVPYPGILEMLERLSQAGVRMAIVSNKTTPTSRPFRRSISGPGSAWPWGSARACAASPAPTPCLP